MFSFKTNKDIELKLVELENKIHKLEHENKLHNWIDIHGTNKYYLNGFSYEKQNEILLCEAIRAIIKHLNIEIYESPAIGKTYQIRKIDK